MTLRKLHRLMALPLAAFIGLHLANHVLGLWGQESHRAVQDVLRQLYRHPAVEPALLALFVVQAGTGLRMAVPSLRHVRRLPLWPLIQRLSGLYLAVFLCVHLGAVLAARAQGGETDLAFAATAFQADGLWPWLFAPYYGLAVASVGIHFAAAVQRQRPQLARLVGGLGLALSLALLLLLSGKITPISIPPAQIAAFPLMP